MRDGICIDLIPESNYLNPVSNEINTQTHLIPESNNLKLESNQAFYNISPEIQGVHQKSGNHSKVFQESFKAY
jgi:hypothetical protein